MFALKFDTANAAFAERGADEVAQIPQKGLLK